MKILDKLIKSNIISLIFVTLILILMTVFVTNKYIESNFKSAYNVDNFIVDSDKTIKTTLKKLSDIDGLNEKAYSINITNNGEKRNYKILLSPIVDNDDDIRLSLNGYITRTLSKFDKEDNSYVIYSDSLNTQYTSINKIKIWQNSDSKIDNIKVNFEIKFKVD